VAEHLLSRGIMSHFLPFISIVNHTFLSAPLQFLTISRVCHLRPLHFSIVFYLRHARVQKERKVCLRFFFHSVLEPVKRVSYVNLVAM